jgi:hypothetical protein
VYKRDGRLVPFEVDKISRALFAATECLGRPDAFVARELADGILHFLAAEAGVAIPTTGQIADTVTKVVRELGQPALAQAFAQGQTRKAELAGHETPSAARSALPAQAGPSMAELSRWVEETPAPAMLTWRTSGACLRAFSLRNVFTRDLVGAQSQGLLTLAGLEAPLELAGCVLGPLGSPSLGMIEAVEGARAIAGDVVAIDNPEYTLLDRLGPREVEAFVRELGTGLRATGLRAVVNLNCAVPPSWADDLAEGPLFVEQRHPPDTERRAALTDVLLKECLVLASVSGKVRVDWHLGADDFLPETEARLMSLARTAVGGAPLAFVFDRPRRPVSLAEGLDRTHPAVLLGVGLHLPRLIEPIEDRKSKLEDAHAAAVFVHRLGSLVRLALSAAVQKRDFLRRHSHGRPALTRGFLLDRARLVLVPVGLEATVHALLDRGLCAGMSSLDLGRQIILRLREVAERDGQASRLDTCLDSAAEFVLGDGSRAGAAALSEVAGLTPWDASATAKSQLRTAGSLHAAAGGGSMAVLVAADRPLTADAVVEWLRYAWQQTEAVRVRFPHIPATQAGGALFPEQEGPTVGSGS